MKVNINFRELVIMKILDHGVDCTEQYWDDAEALSLFQVAVERVKKNYTAGSWAWAVQKRSDLWQAVKTSENSFNKAYRRRNMDNCKRAAKNYVQAFILLIEAFRKIEN